MCPSRPRNGAANTASHNCKYDWDGALERCAAEPGARAAKALGLAATLQDRKSVGELSFAAARLAKRVSKVSGSVLPASCIQAGAKL